MTATRLLRWTLLLAGLIACTAWAYVAINHLLNSSMSNQQRLSEYNTTVMPPSPILNDMKIAQRHWGTQSLFAVACAFFFLLATMMNWVLDGRPRRSPTSISQA